MHYCSLLHFPYSQGIKTQREILGSCKLTPYTRLYRQWFVTVRLSDNTTINSHLEFSSFYHQHIIKCKEDARTKTSATEEHETATRTASALSLSTLSHYQLSVSRSAAVKTNPHPLSVLFCHFQLLVLWQAVVKQNVVLCSIDKWQFQRTVKSVWKCRTWAQTQWPAGPITKLWWQKMTELPCE